MRVGTNAVESFHDEPGAGKSGGRRVGPTSSSVVDWLDDVLDWLREPMTEMPIDLVSGTSAGGFMVNLCSWNR